MTLVWHKLVFYTFPVRNILGMTNFPIGHNAIIDISTTHSVTNVRDEIASGPCPTRAEAIVVRMIGHPSSQHGSDDLVREVHVSLQFEDFPKQ